MPEEPEITSSPSPVLRPPPKIMTTRALTVDELYTKTKQEQWPPERSDEERANERERFIGAHTKLRAELTSEKSKHEEDIHDELTGLYTRKEFMNRLNAEVDRNKRYKDKLALVIFDLDKFREANESYGHAGGDAVLTEIGRIIREQIRASDTAGRIGGDEFAIILAEQDLDKAEEFCKRMQEAITHTIIRMPGGERYQVGATFGITSLNGSDNEPDSKEELFQRADDALYVGKDFRGKNTIVRSDQITPQETSKLKLSRWIKAQRWRKTD